MPLISGGWCQDDIYCSVIDSQYGDQIFKKVVRECVIRALVTIEETGTLQAPEIALRNAVAISTPFTSPNNSGYDPDIDRIIRLIWGDTSGQYAVYRLTMMPSSDITNALTAQWANILKKYS
jgi:hypothetical protein